MSSYVDNFHGIESSLKQGLINFSFSLHNKLIHSYNIHHPADQPICLKSILVGAVGVNMDQNYGSILILSNNDLVLDQILLHPNSAEHQVVKHIIEHGFVYVNSYGSDGKGLDELNVQSLLVTDVIKLVSYESSRNFIIRRDYIHKMERDNKITSLVSILEQPNSSLADAQRPDEENYLNLHQHINETLLLHGISVRHIRDIVNSGLDIAHANASMLGKALYFTDCSTKAMCYCDKTGLGMRERVSIVICSCSCFE